MHQPENVIIVSLDGDGVGSNKSQNNNNRAAILFSRFDFTDSIVDPFLYPINTRNQRYGYYIIILYMYTVSQKSGDNKSVVFYYCNHVF